MSVLRQQNWLGQQRVDVPHLRSLDSAISADFDLLAGSIVSGGKALVVRGFDLVANTGPATSLQLNVAGGILMHQDASEAGTIFSVVDDATVETLDSTNPNVSGSFTPGQTNYVGLDLVRAADSSTSDLVMFWDPNASDETPKTVPLARTLGYKIVISTTDFDSTPNILPIAKVTTNALNVVVALTDIQDARQLAFRLGSGGSSPDKAHAFAWPEGRNENTATTGFSGGDKAIGSLKDWMDAAMTRLWELGGGEFWYSSTADRNVVLVSTGTTFSNGENFSWDGTNLTWQGLQFLFDNSTGWYNEVKAQTASSAGLTNLADGECIYVDLDRTQNLTGASALVPAKAILSTLGPGSVPGARQVIAWRRGTNVFTKGSKYPVGAMYTAASTTALGLVKLSKAPTDPLNPVALTDTEKNAASGVASLDSNRFVIAMGITRDTAGALSIGTGANDNSVTIGKASATVNFPGNAVVSTTTLAAAWKAIYGKVTGTTYGYGLYGENNTSDGTNAGYGVIGLTTNGNGGGGKFTGFGTGIGVYGIGGASAGTGVIGQGGTGGAGGKFTGDGAGSGVEATAGSTGAAIKLSAPGGPAIRVTGLASAPASPQDGDKYYDTTLKVWRVYFGDLGEWSHTTHAPSYATGWSDWGKALKYWLDADRRLQMVGGAQSASSGTVFTLPTGFRPPLPAGTNVFWKNDGSTTVNEIDPSGNVICTGTNFTSDGCNFSTIF